MILNKTHLLTGSSKIIPSENLTEKTFFLVPHFLYTQLYLTPLEHYHIPLEHYHIHFWLVISGGIVSPQTKSYSKLCGLGSELYPDLILSTTTAKMLRTSAHTISRLKSRLRIPSLPPCENKLEAESAGKGGGMWRGTGRGDMMKLNDRRKWKSWFGYGSSSSNFAHRFSVQNTFDSDRLYHISCLLTSGCMGGWFFNNLTAIGLPPV